MTKNSPTVLVACEFSGIVRDAFARHGFTAYSCDLLPSERHGLHLQQDVREIINEPWTLVVAHPPCTYLCNSGVRWLFDGKLNRERFALMKEAIAFFKVFLNCKAPFVAIENPIMHSYARDRIKVKYSQTIRPFQFGHNESKATCLWLKNLPNLKSTNIVNCTESRIHKAPPSKDRWKDRSRTFEGIAEAMATQWSNIIKENA